MVYLELLLKHQWTVMDYDVKLAYPVPEAGKQIGISRSQTYELIKSGNLKSFTIGKRRLVSRDALREFIRAREAA
jgi:excisionase family DNA binding protein